MHRSAEELEHGIENILASPKNSGNLDLIVARPKTNARKVLTEAKLSLELGLEGDNWKIKPYSKSPDGFGHPEMQLNIMNSRVIDLIAETKQDWPLAGDQLYVDMDLSKENLPAGTRLSLGNAEVEVTAEPHLGCKKFSDRFGRTATLFVNSDFGKAHCFRGICAKVVKQGEIQLGDKLTKI